MNATATTAGNVTAITAKVVTIADAIKAGVKANKAQMGVWNALVLALAPSGYEHDAAVELAKQGEKAYKDSAPKDAEIPSTYRSAKSVALAALKNSVSLVTDSGLPRGKSEVEADIKTAKGDKSAIDKVRATLNTLASLLDKCSDAERAEAKPLIVTLMAEKFAAKKAA